jgi:hypothetical protein
VDFLKEVHVVYSPVCEANGAFIGLLEEWLGPAGVRINLIPAHAISARELAWYREAGMVGDDGKLRSSVFIDVFCEGLLIDTVPLKRENMERFFGITIKESHEAKGCDGAETISPADFKNLLCHGEVKWIPITADSFAEEMTMCLQNYPHGNPPSRYHGRCKQLKEAVYREVFQIEDIAGVYGRWKEKVIGLLEVFPRNILQRHGFLTGNKGIDTEYLTVGCYEVGYGMPRIHVIDELMFQLEMLYPAFRRPYLEGVGVLEWQEGFTPYWVYDKYGFKQSQSITEKQVLMEKGVK